MWHRSDARRSNARAERGLSRKTFFMDLHRRLDSQEQTITTCACGLYVRFIRIYLRTVILESR